MGLTLEMAVVTKSYVPQPDGAVRSSVESRKRLVWVIVK